MQPLIRIAGLSKSYGSSRILDDLSLDIPAGQKVALIGPSGSGKTTILRILMTLESIDSGQVEIGGARLFDETATGPAYVAERRLRPIRAQVGMVFQHFGLFPHLTVERNIVLPQILNRVASEPEARRKAMELLDLMGLADKAAHYPDRLSGGQKQRVAIARALALQPRVMLFDEPTSALDPLRVNEVLQVLHAVARTTDMTMLLVTHEMSFARNFADRVLFFDHGRIVEDGPPDAVFDTPRDPRTQAFLRLSSQGE
ncbi:amino acid ABC transporter ATP-binding protein [Gluconacetobacter azotocaptans]|uniref:amino acid ABC transporter ATP-binding protein n=1 Tax=Gluconacetobacter azotocaptans TaxID=142834 RepID=UPI0019578341|nr:amino acid ABC transporter ATP-binding protein [Gluconacetobacter azotocaptans]MBM9401510.1 amino acid ABC transporter ATP-binding protein [Gluconacetobacter azotocaptans]